MIKYIKILCIFVMGLMWINYSQTAQALSVAPSFSFSASLNINAMKKCTKCKAKKELSEFSNDKTRPDGKFPWCKDCKNKQNLIYSRTEMGIITTIYATQKQKSKKRGDVLPNYTKAELWKWVHSQHKFGQLYVDWIYNNFNSNFKPSCDRKDDYKPYTLDNLQLTTWDRNNRRGHNDRRNGVNNKINISVLQFTIDKDNKFISEYYSMRQAMRTTGIRMTSISSVCKGKRKTAGGFIWKLKS